MAHDHENPFDYHDHDSHALPKDFGRAFAFGIALNSGFVIIEVVYGFLANSMALLADAGHNFSDVLGLVMAWIATLLARRLPSQTHTYGMRRGTILAALANAVLLLVAVGAIILEAVRRLLEPADVAGGTVMWVAAIGIAVNGVTAWLFASGRKGDLNVRGAFLHMVYDALVSLGVVIAGGAVLLTGWRWLDPLVSLAVAAVILLGSWKLLRDAVSMALDAVPDGLRLGEIGDFLRQLPGVSAIHDLHVWPMSTTENALTCHCVMLGGHPGDVFLIELARELKKRFKIDHATIQIEVHANNACALEPAHVV